MSVILRPPYGLQGATIQGKASIYTANADGTYTVASYSEALALVGAGWQVESLGSQAEAWVQSSLAVVVGQTMSVYGAATAMGPNVGNGSMTVDSCDIVFGGTFGSETVTVLFTMTYDDASTQTTTYTATGTGTTVLTLAQLRALAKNNRSLKAIAVQAKSSLSGGSSIATVVINSHGLNL